MTATGSGGYLLSMRRLCEFFFRIIWRDIAVATACFSIKHRTKLSISFGEMNYLQEGKKPDFDARLWRGCISPGLFITGPSSPHSHQRGLRRPCEYPGPRWSRFLPQLRQACLIGGINPWKSPDFFHTHRRAC